MYIVGPGLVVVGLVLVWSLSSPKSSSGRRRSAVMFLLWLACHVYSWSEPSGSPKISSVASLIWKIFQAFSSAPDPFGTHRREAFWRVLATRGGCWPAFATKPPNLLAEGRPSSSSSSPDLDAERRRSPGYFLRGDGRVVSTTPVTFLAEWRPCVATVWAGHCLHPPSSMTFWRPFCSEAKVANHGSLVAPSGSIPGNSEVVPERVLGPDHVLHFVLVVLPANVQGLDCNLFYYFGPNVIIRVLSLPY